MPNQNADARLELLADRLAVALVILKSRHIGWDWLFGEHMWEDDAGMAAEVREWPEYQAAKEIVRIFVKRLDKRLEEERRDAG